MIKRKDGSYSQRGLWDNIRANKGSGKKPTKEMLKQEKKIKEKKEMGGKKKLYKKGGKSEFGMLSVKAGVDNNPNPTAADRIVGAKKNKMQTGGVDKTSERFKNAQANTKIRNERQEEEKRLSNVKKSGKDVNYADRTKMKKGGAKKKMMKKGSKKKMMGGGMQKMYRSGGFLDAPSVADLDNL